MILEQRIFRQSLYFAVVLTCWLSTSHAAEPKFFNVIEKLHVTLLQHYNNQILPVINHTQAVDLKVMLDLANFDFDDLHSRFSAKGFFYMSWNDPRFIWLPSEYEGLASIHVPKGKIWTPDLEVYNSPGILSSDRSFAINTDTLIHNDGTVYYIPPSSLVSTCISDPTFYPFECVTCTVVIGSWTHDAQKINITIKDNASKVTTTNLASQWMSNWNLIDTRITTESKLYPCCPEAYQNVKMSFTVKRSFSTLKAIVTPTIAIMILTLATFFVPPAVSAKLFVGMMNLAMTSGYLLYFHTALPSGSTRSPLIVSFFSNSLILTIISMVSNIFTLRWIRLSKSPPPTFIQSCLSSFFGRILGVTQQDKRSRCSVDDMLTENKGQNQWENDGRDSVKQLWMNVGLALDRLMLFVYCAVNAFFFSFYLD